MTACLYSSKNVVIPLIYCRPTMYLEFRPQLTVCLRVNILSNMPQDVMRECTLLSVYAHPFILCFVFVNTIVLTLTMYFPYYLVFPSMLLLVYNYE